MVVNHSDHRSLDRALTGDEVRWFFRGGDKMTPTAKQLRAEIESGPLAADLAPFWADVFPAEPEPPLVDVGGRARWERIRPRFGSLTPDAVFHILDVLRRPRPAVTVGFPALVGPRSRLDELGWAVTEDDVRDAKAVPQ